MGFKLFNCKWAAACLFLLLLLDFRGLTVNGLECPVCLHKKGEKKECKAMPCNTAEEMGEAEKKIDTDKVGLLGADPDMKARGGGDDTLVSEIAAGTPLPFVCYKGIGDLEAETGGSNETQKRGGEKETLKDVEFNTCGKTRPEHPPQKDKYKVEMKNFHRTFTFKGELWACDTATCATDFGSGGDTPPGSDTPGGGGDKRAPSPFLVLAVSVVSFLQASWRQRQQSRFMESC